MKTKKTVYIVLSCFFFFFNVMAYVSLLNGTTEADTSVPGYWIGYNFFFYISALFAFLAWRTGRKIKRKKEHEVLQTLLNEEPK